jgi:hypothetical protein
MVHIYLKLIVVMSYRTFLTLNRIILDLERIQIVKLLYANTYYLQDPIVDNISYTQFHTSTGKRTFSELIRPVRVNSCEKFQNNSGA